jgi:hypothetical protein
MDRRRIAAVLAVAVSLLVAAPAAQARIVPQDNIAKVKIGMTAEKVLEILGQNAKTITTPDGITTYTYRRKGIKVHFKPNRANTHWIVFAVEVYRHRRQLTAEGIGIRSTRREVKRKIAGVHCKRYDPSYAICIVGSGRRGKISTVFQLSHSNRVKSVILEKPFED